MIWEDTRALKDCRFAFCRHDMHKAVSVGGPINFPADSPRKLFVVLLRTSIGICTRRSEVGVPCRLPVSFPASTPRKFEQSLFGGADALGEPALGP